MEKFICLLIFAVSIASFLATVILPAVLKIGSGADLDAEKIGERHREETARAANRPRRFYSIEEQDDGTVDVYLCPDLVVYDTDLGIKEYDIELRVVRGIVPWDGLEEDIRDRYYDWCASAQPLGIG